MDNNIIENSPVEPKLSKKELLKKKKLEDKKIGRQAELKEHEWKVFDEKNKQTKSQQKQFVKNTMKQQQEENENEKKKKQQEINKDFMSVKISKPIPATNPMKYFMLNNKNKTIEDWKVLDETNKEIYKEMANKDKERYKKELQEYEKRNNMVEKVSKGKKDRKRS